jgi:hypothetical protein
MLCFFASIFFPAFTYFRLLYVLPAFYILIAYGILHINSRVLTYFVFFAIFAANFLSLFIYYSDMNQQREQWKQAVFFLEQKANAKSIAVFDYPEPFAPYRWYEKGILETKGATDSIYANPKATENKTRSILVDKSTAYYFEYLRDLSDPNSIVQKTMESEGFGSQEVYNFAGVGLIRRYER